MKIGAQLYNIRAYAQNEKDFARSMKRIREAGFSVVQISGCGPIAPEKLREICDNEGLTVALTHTNPDRILNDTENVIREHEILGCKYVGIGGMPERYRSAEWIDCFKEDFTEPAKKLRDHGMLLMYHNHNFEFGRLHDGRRMIDVLVETMPASLMGFTLDTYWVQAGGADVCDWLIGLSDRIPCVHFKDMTVNGFEQRFAPIGEGNLNFVKIVSTLEKLGSTEYALIEQDNCYGDDPFDCLRRSCEYLKSLGCKTE